MKKNLHQLSISVLMTGLLFLLVMTSCNLPKPEKGRQIRVKNNFIVLLDLSDRIIVQPGQQERDKEIVQFIYDIFEQNVRENLYIKSRDEIRVVIAPQKGTDLPIEDIEDRLYINMDNINRVYRKSKEKERRETFMTGLEELYTMAAFSRDPGDYHGADIWKYFYEDLKYDYVSDTLTHNYLFILTDGYPIVGKNQNKLQPVSDIFPDLNVVILEAAPREKDMEWDRVMERWGEWFDEIRIPEYSIIKRRAITKEKEMIKEIVLAKAKTELQEHAGM